MSMIKKLFLLFLLTLFLNTGLLNAQENNTGPEFDENGFITPPDEYKPWCYYWNLKGNFTEEKFTKDLEAMKSAGFGGLLFFDSRGYHEDPEHHIPVPVDIKYEFMSPEWQDKVTFMIREADRLGLKVSMNLSNTGGHLRGPWDFREDGPRELIWTEGNFNGPKTVSVPMPLPQPDEQAGGQAPYYRDVVVLAVKVKTEPSPEREKIRLNETWGSAVEPTADSPLVGEVVNITDNVQNGTLLWDVPEGVWKILRFGSRVIGDFGSLDILNKEVVSRYFDMFGTKMLDNAGSSAGKSLTHFYNVSWEGSNPNWTEGFDRFFQEKRGYEIWSYLPTLRGLNVGSAAESQRFLVDFYRTISDCFCENCYCQIGKLSHERGILWHSENGGPWPRQAPMFRESDMLTFWGQNDFPQGEFWVVEQKKRETRSNMKYVASASHIYGQKLASVEAFTHMTHHWTLYPDILKVAADSNLIDGANMFIWHTFSNSPDEFGKPGLEYFAGTHINTNVTWFDKVGDFTKYLARCQYLLRQGTYNADFCVYVSDKNYVSWGRGEKWNPNSALVPPAGYAYDFLDTGALLNRLTFEDGRLTLPDGQSYRYLIVDPIEKELPVASLQKILTLVEQGATVLLGGCRPEHDRSLKNYPNNDQEVVGLAEKLWGNGSEKVRALGLGKVYSGVTIPEFLAAEKDLPDFEGPFEYHRRNTSQGVIYFVSGTGGHADCIFRVAGKKPEFWDPMNGTTVPAAVYSPTDDGRTRVTLDLPKDGSVFVVFRSPMDNQHFTGLEGPEAGLTFAANQDGALSCVQWKEGEYRLTTPDSNVRTVAEKCPEPLTLDGPWNVSFDPAWGGPENIVFDKLTYWNDRPEPGIKYYSGTAFYRKTFDVPANQIGYKMELSLGKVGVISRVWINGKEAGILWTDPWTAEISDFVTAGQNELVVEVSNCWANRLIGDAGLPPEQRLTKTNLHLYNKKDGAKQPFQGFSNEDPLRNSGLLGPVQIRFGVPCEIKF